MLMASCSGIYKNYERPQTLAQGIDSLYRNTTTDVVKADTASYGNTPWQEVFTDPQLQALINKALANNTNLLNADLSIQQIQAGLKMQRLAYYPSIAFQPQGTMSSWDFNKASKTYAFPIAASWQFGSMGSIRNTKKQYEMNLEMTKAAKQATRTAIIANVANLYYTLQMLDEQLKTTQPFFANAARGVFSAYLLACIRMSREDAEMREECLNNRTLRSYFHRAGLEQYTRLANAYSDLNAIKMYIGDGQNNQALGVLAEVLVMVRDCFFNVFGEKGDFSIRDFVRKKSGRTLFIEYDLSVGETLSPLYSLLIDLALKDALGQQKSQGNVYIIIDEFKLLPHLLHIDDAVNFGRSMGVKVIAALQSISQLFDMYGEQKGRSITAGFNTLMAFRPNDSVTREYLRDYFGRNMVSETVLINRAPVTERREGHTVEDWELAAFRPGEAAVMINGEEPFLYQFDPYKEG